jgi:hypothetical protein
MNSAVAQEKAPAVKTKVLFENDKVRAYEVSYVPGAENKGVVASTMRVIRVLKGGTLQRIYEDGKKENVVYKTGDTKPVNPGPAYFTKNVGKTELLLYVVMLK